MFLHYRTQGLILEKADRQESDQFFTIYTRDFGKLEILGKAIRKIKSKLRSGIENFYLTEIEFIQGKTYKTLTDAILIDKFKNLREDLGRLKIAYQIADVFNNLVSGQEQDEKIWYLLINTFQKLNSQRLKISDQKLLFYYFLWRFFSLLGYSPRLYNCLFCQRKLIPGIFYFDHEEGGIICSNCFKKKKNGQIISAEIIKILRFILEKDWSQVKRLKVEAGHLKVLKIISGHYFSSLPKLNLTQT